MDEGYRCINKMLYKAVLHFIFRRIQVAQGQRVRRLTDQRPLLDSDPRKGTAVVALSKMINRKTPSCTNGQELIYRRRSPG